MDDNGQGATVIWSWGLPFLPGYTGAARAGRPELPIQRPSVNVVVYGPEGERFYLLSELAADQCDWGSDGRSWRLGNCAFTWTDTPGAAGAGPIRSLQADLDLALPTGGRATGKLWLSGPLRRDPCGTPAEPASTHRWTPMIAASRGGFELDTPGGRVSIEGRGYHDRNSAGAPLHALGIQSWWWGRIALPGRDLICYRLIPSAPGGAPRDLVVELAADGTSRIRDDARLQTARMRRSLWGLRWPAEVRFADPDGQPVQAEVRTLVDNGPFYQRYLLRARCGAEEGYGVGEHLVPGRVDGDLMRPLVRMRVHRADGPNSMWLPLFCGDAEGRVGRLLRRSGNVRV